MSRAPRAFALGAVLGAGAVACGASGAGDPDLGAIDDTVAFERRVDWPGLERATGRVIPMQASFGDGVPTTYWFLGFGQQRTADAYFFCREGDTACPLDAQRRIVWAAAAGAPLFSRIPGEEGYSPYWQMWRVVVPADFVAGAVKTPETLDSLVVAGRLRVEPVQLDFGVWFGEQSGVGPALVHLPLVLAGTELEDNGAPMVDGSGPSLRIERRAGWYRSHRVEFFDFSASDGAFPQAAGSGDRPLMRFANLYILWRRCDVEPRPAICDLPGTLNPSRRPVSERGLGQDITGDGEVNDSNNVLGATPCVLTRPTERPYSPLWGPQASDIIDEPIGLIDTYQDESQSQVRSAEDYFNLIGEGRLTAPEPMTEDETGNPMPGNEGRVLFNCPSPVPQGHVPFPCEANP